MIDRVLALMVALSASAAIAADAGATISGVVKDRSGAPVTNAQVSLLNPQQAVLATTHTDGQGSFSFPEAAVGSYLLLADAPGLLVRRTAVSVGVGPVRVEVSLDVPQLREEVTVTANPGRVEGVDGVSQSVNVVREDEIGERAKSVVAQVANQEAGLHLQRTSPTMAGIFVRGLTGAKVSVFVDGQRYSTASARGGVNTFLDLIGADTLEAVEVLRGPSSAQYGSDALGGSVQFLTRTPALTAAGRELHGSYGVGFGSADQSGSSHLGATYSGTRVAIMGSLAAQRVNTLRAGGATDSHNALRRYLGVDPADALDEGRLPDTAFTQYGGMLKLNWVPSAHDHLVASYTRSQQDGGKRYDQLLGGDGNLIADLRNLMLDRASLKYDRSGFGFFDTLSLGYSYNAQREERVNQGGNGNPRNAVNHEYEKTRVHGTQLQMGKAWTRNSLLLGGDFYAEAVTAPSFAFSPVTQGVSARRGRVPDSARYRSGGVFVQDILEAVPDRLRLVGNLRWSTASYQVDASDRLVNGRPLWPADAADFGSFTFRAGAVFTPDPGWSLSANVSRGFRAPHITDLGTVGLTGSGYEVAPSALTGLGATVGSTAGSGAVTSGMAADRLAPERSLSYEAAIRYHRGRLDTDLVGFINDVKGNIQKQALILPQGAVGLSLGGETVLRQTEGGVVFVSASDSPVLVNANFDNARIWGIEHTLDFRASGDLTLGSTFTYLHAEDRSTGLPPNIEGGTPAPDGWLRLRYAPPTKRYFVEPYVHLAARQSRLSSLDLEDRRTGATRSRSSIASFFNNGARARGLIGNGADGQAGTADDVLLSSGETLAQIQSRVLGSANSAPLYTSIPGYVTFNLRGGYRLAAGHQLLLDVENIGDRNYRGITWGVDGPGFGVSIRYVGRF